MKLAHQVCSLAHDEVVAVSEGLAQRGEPRFLRRLPKRLQCRDLILKGSLTGHRCQFTRAIQFRGDSPERTSSSFMIWRLTRPFSPNPAAWHLSEGFL